MDELYIILKQKRHLVFKKKYVKCTLKFPGDYCMWKKNPQKWIYHVRLKI